MLTSLATLTRVETQVAANEQAMAQARQNALLALNIALGQLQKYAGPDARVTARAEITSVSAVTNPQFTGVWAAGSFGAAPDVWLVSGSERPGATAADVWASAPDPADDMLTDDTVFLVGNASVAVDPASPTAVEKTRRIKLAKQDIFAPAGGVAGLASSTATRIGRYAWCVEDQGVKASLALPDRADQVTYAPWSTPTQRRRIRQQLASTPNYFRASSATTVFPKEGFDPLAAGGALGRVQTPAQLAYLTPTAGVMTEFLRAHRSDFTTVARAVAANTRTDAHRGLMRDLSLRPEMLGAAFAAYARYPAYTETPGATLENADPAYPEILDADSPRRRCRLVPPVTAGIGDGLPDLVFGISPVLTELMLQFKFERSSANRLAVKARLYVALWNPYTSALAPASTDALALEITGLPQVTVTDAVTGASTTVDLQAALPATIKGAGGELRVGLPFGEGKTTNGTKADRSSWLPGRVYGWTTETGATPSGNLQFYSKNISTQGWAYATVPLAGLTNNLGVTTGGAISGLTVRVRSAAGVLATCTTPPFRALDIAASTTTWKFAFATRIRQPLSGDSDRTWLKVFDPRDDALPATAFGGFDPNQDTTPLDPSVYAGPTAPSTAYPQYLLYRIQGSLAGTAGLSQGSYNDTPLFELPRLPLLSVGELRHQQVRGARPFSIGNSWGGTANAIFDRCFFSGLPATVSAATGEPDLAAGQPLPNWNLQVVDAPDIATVRAAGEFSSRHLLQAGGFNVNSTRVAAWRAVLASVRFGDAFHAADLENTAGDALGTQRASDATASEPFNGDATLGASVPAPAFLRFAQSAQETFFWRPATGASADKRQFSNHAFRLGVRACNDVSASAPSVVASVTAHRISTDQLEALAGEIVRLIQARAVSRGPFRSLEEFLGPQTGPGTPSLLEAAIDAAGINPDEVKPLDHVALLSGGGYGAGFSSLTLTQADLLAALAPYLRTRSDTFTIRAYGEALNPATSAVASKAWLEAVAQRFPEAVEAGDDIAQPAGIFGRRFKIISFRWLTSSDI
ncbi:MAG TPA: hypothetical protein VIM44_03745 [Rariglobus sp.]